MYIVWIDNSPIIGSSETSENKKILLRKSVDRGNTFGETIVLSSNNSVDSINQEITATGNNVYVVWQDTTLAEAEDADIASGAHNSSAYNNAYNSSNINHQNYGRVMFTSSENSGESFISPKS